MGRYHDNPTGIDSLGRDPLLREVAEHIWHSETPQVVGLFGDWGSGKTSFLIRLQAYLSGVASLLNDEEETDTLTSIANSPGLWEKKDNEPLSRMAHPVVWFEAWRYQHEPQPVIALLQEIRSQFSPGSKIGQFVSKEAQVAVEAALLSIPVIASVIGPAAKSAREVGERFEQERFAVAPTTTAIRRQLEHSVKVITGQIGLRDSVTDKVKRLWNWKNGPDGKSRRLVVIIDDLDRCEPEAAWSLLEGIKVYLNLKDVVFVLGVNYHVIEDHLRTKLQERGEEAAFRARDYLEKLCPTRFYLSTASRCDGLFLAESNQGVHWETWRKHILELLPRNPRKIKAFIATLQEFERRMGAEPTDILASTAFCLAYLRYFHYRLYRLVEADSGFFNDVLKRWAKGQHDMDLTPFIGIHRKTSKAVARPDAFEFGSAAVPEDDKDVLCYRDPMLDSVFHIQELVTIANLEAQTYERLVAGPPCLDPQLSK